MLDVSRVLTPEQRAQLAERMKERRERMEERMKRHMDRQAERPQPPTQ
jgi:Spy/CpxP family protein refolding chaperone